MRHPNGTEELEDQLLMHFLSPGALLTGGSGGGQLAAFQAFIYLTQLQQVGAALLALAGTLWHPPLWPSSFHLTSCHIYWLV